MEKMQIFAVNRLPNILSPGTRNRRIDLVRGFALLAVFIDHIPENSLYPLTLQSNALSDAADIFIFLAGYSAWIAYSPTFDQVNMWAGFRRVLDRCGELYIMQVVMLLICFLIAYTWSQFTILKSSLILQVGDAGLARILILYAQPTYFDILPLYVLMLMVFPFVWAGLRWQPLTTLLISAGIWLLVNFNPDLNMPEWIGRRGWAFNPFEWQFLFTIGAAAAAANTSGKQSLQCSSLITATCWIFLGEAWFFIYYYAWHASGTPASHFVGSDHVFSHLLRLLSGLAIIYLVLTSERFARLVESGWFLAIEVCGRHSLAVFGLSTVLSMVGRFAFRTFGSGMLPQAVVNGVGIVMLLAAAELLDRRRQRCVF